MMRNITGSMWEKIVRDYLIKEDVLFQIELFVNGEAFCEKEENIQKFDIIFLDIEMDGMNGMETAHFIHERNPGIDIVFITVCPNSNMKIFYSGCFWLI